MESVGAAGSSPTRTPGAVEFVEVEVGKKLVVDDPAGAFSVTTPEYLLEVGSCHPSSPTVLSPNLRN
jgi:hypothetical protein